jgi:hypothetical protein
MLTGIDGSNPGTINPRMCHFRSYMLPDYIWTILIRNITCVLALGRTHGRSFMRTLAILAYRGRPNPEGHRASKPILMLIQLNGIPGRR